MLFIMAKSVSSNFKCFWRGSIFKIFFRGEGLEERTKTRLYFRALFVHCDAVPQKKIPRTGQWTGLNAFSLNRTFDNFISYFLVAAIFWWLPLSLCSETMNT